MPFCVVTFKVRSAESKPMCHREAKVSLFVSGRRFPVSVAKIWRDDIKDSHKGSETIEKRERALIGRFTFSVFSVSIISSFRSYCSEQGSHGWAAVNSIHSQLSIYFAVGFRVGRNENTPFRINGIRNFTSGKKIECVDV